MAQTSDPRSRQWAAFLAGAVVMLLIVLVWFAWRGVDVGVGALRDVTLPHRPSLPALPTNPPPEGPHLPPAPLPTPK
jgi:hypothetical protein